jgi:hypothetical protein
MLGGTLPQSPRGWSVRLGTSVVSGSESGGVVRHLIQDQTQKCVDGLPRSVQLHLSTTLHLRRVPGLALEVCYRVGWF